ncbi:unnamed protein product [Phytomonas sp. EM1]|nr:unnamed protein product [Phytomonas sp. EM1]|eukprot:CCW61129.1 unnamed protein product [Phytomonas sp. isolate EM1]
MKDLEVDFVLVRGPHKVNRRFHLIVPRDSTPVIIGRGLHCAAVLDPWLVFASQVQCSLFCVSPALPIEVYKDDDQEKTLGISSAVSFATLGPTLPLPCLYILDMCSSNGTFVNNIRIGGIEPVLLNDGDSCIFGGMRDVGVGEALPLDAFDGPELCIWRVNILNGKDVAIEHDYQPTPALFPTPDRLEWEEKAFLGTVLRTFHEKHAITTKNDLMTPGQVLACPSTSVAITPPTAVSQRLFITPDTQLQPQSRQTDRFVFVKEDDNEMRENRSYSCKSSVEAALEFDEHMERQPGSHDEKDKVLVQNEAAPASNTPSRLSKAGAEPIVEDTCQDSSEGSLRRSRTVAARLTTEFNTCKDLNISSDESLTNSCNAGLPVTTTPRSLFSAPMICPDVPRPAIAYLRAVRLGHHTFHVQEESILTATTSERIDNMPTLDDSNKLKNFNYSCSTNDLERYDTQAGTRWAKQSSIRLSDDTPVKKIKKKRLDRSDFSEVAVSGWRPPLFSSPSPFTMEFTETHWKWCMDNPNDFCEPGRNVEIRANDSSSVFRCILPVSSIGAIFACKERVGIAIKLKEGCQVPLVRPEILSGGPEYRWIVWTLQRFVMPSNNRGTTEATKGKNIEGHKSKKCKKGKCLPTTNGVLSSLVEFDKEGIKDVDFKTWLEQLEAFYSPYKVPQIHMVDMATFDNFFAPQMH